MKMEIQKLGSFVLLIVLVGMIIGIGVMVSDKFASATYYTREDYNDSIVVANNTRQALDKGNVSVSAVWNGTKNLYSSNCYDIFSTNGSIVFKNNSDTCALFTATSYVIYDWYDYDTATSAAMGNVSKEISAIASNWLGLIVTVTIMSIILFLVVRSFSGGGYTRK